MDLYIGHPPTRRNQETRLAADYDAGVGSLVVKNVDGFNASRYAVLGAVGFEQAEIVRPATITEASQTFTLAANTKFPHNADTKITYIDYNQIKVYRSTTGISGAYTLVSTLDIDIDGEMTLYQETNALTTYYYKFTYYNSFATIESDQSDPIAATGFVFQSLKTMIDRVLSMFGDQASEFVTPEEVQDFINEIYEHAQQMLAISSNRFGIEQFPITVATGVIEYNLPSDFLVEKAIKVSTDNGVTYPYVATMRQLDASGYGVENMTKYHYTVADKLRLEDPIPTNSTDILLMFYIATPTRLSAQTDVLDAPFSNASAIFVRYALAQCYIKDKKFEEAKQLEDWVNTRLNTHLAFVKRMTQKHPQYTTLNNVR